MFKYLLKKIKIVLYKSLKIDVNSERKQPAECRTGRRSEEVYSECLAHTFKPGLWNYKLKAFICTVCVKSQEIFVKLGILAFVS